jgi:Flp pilus assembly protein TadG
VQAVDRNTSCRRRALLRAVSALSLCRRGTVAIEFAFVAPAFFLLVFGIIEFGRGLWTLNALHYSVEEAARCASINTVTCATASQVESFAASRSGAAFTSSVFTATSASCGNQVSASYSMPLYIPFATHSVTLTAQSCYPI